MSIINGINGLAPAPKKRQVYSPFEKYWIAFLEWRKRDRLRAQLCHLTDSELADIGMTRGEIDYVTSHRDIDPEVSDRRAERPLPAGE
ncbi:DUF1127 domain-containing protein [Bradyrhizobium sp. CB3481]|uniref:DUF1127 domain-containing protein n=1 Tax=Bradyrhizobium sp. CB3481 TaxID=3039158 RepID=UPI0024B0F036|nr:DUF1127 domain-containing protein [Bradyrhizobium sp. CB3481]WFU16029.1 DUF1127 domain-containing protein [Bradyrhizobium sp. CB3481]